MNQQQLIQALAMDLKRVAVCLHRGSDTVADRFIEEALKREADLSEQATTEYIKNLLMRMKQSLLKKNTQTAEDALMYSTLFQNLSLKKY